MAKSTTKNTVPGLSGSPAKTAERIVRLLDESRAVTSMHTYEHFRRTLDIWHAALFQAEMQSWLEACTGMERGLGPLQQALGLLMTEATCNYHDVIGSVYMLLSQGEKRLGQYFTPYPVAKMLAEMNLSDLAPREEGAPPIRILEPTCGSGVMILACAETIETRHPGMILRGDVLFYGVDLDPLCVTMCQINMLLHGIGHIARLPDDDVPDQAGRTPRYRFQPAQIVCGNALTQDTAELFKQETPWIPVTLVLPQAAAASPAGEAGKEDVAEVQGEALVQSPPNTEKAGERHQVANVTAAQAFSIEEAPAEEDQLVEATSEEMALFDQPEIKEQRPTGAEGEREIMGPFQEAPEAPPQELDGGVLPPPVAAMAFSSEKEPEPSKMVGGEEDVFSASSEEISVEQADSLAFPHVSPGQSAARRRSRKKDDSGVVQQALFP